MWRYALCPRHAMTFRAALLISEIVRTVTVTQSVYAVQAQQQSMPRRCASPDRIRFASALVGLYTTLRFLTQLSIASEWLQWPQCLSLTSAPIRLLAARTVLIRSCEHCLAKCHAISYLEHKPRTVNSCGSAVISSVCAAAAAAGPRFVAMQFNQSQHSSRLSRHVL